MGYGLIIAGIAFLFVPAFGLYDFMPDVIGYALIAAGLYKTSQLNGDLHSAARNFRYLLYLSLARLILTPAVAGLRDEMTEMLVVFAFAIAETVFLLPAFSELCEGSYYLSTRAGCDVPDKYHDDLLLTSRVFVIGRAVLAAAPELTVLTNNAYKESVTVDDLQRATLYDSRSVITVACFVISLMIGVVFFILAVRYFGRLRSDKASVAAIAARYDAEIGSDEEKRAYTSVKASASLLTAACVALSGVFIRGVDVIPDFIAAALMLAAFYRLRAVAKTKKAAVVSAVTAALCSGAFALELVTAQKHYNGSFSPSAPFLTVASLRALCFVLFAYLFYLLYGYLCDAVVKYTKAPTFDEAGYLRGLYNRCKLIGIAGIAACAVSAASGFGMLYAGVVRFAGITACVALAVIVYVNTGKIAEEMSRRL